MKVDLEELKRLHEAATPGKWELCNKGDYRDFDGKSRIILGADRRLAVFHVSDTETNANAELLFALRNAFPVILAKLEAAQRLRDAVAEGLAIEFRPMIRNALAAFDKETE